MIAGSLISRMLGQVVSGSGGTSVNVALASNGGVASSNGVHATGTEASLNDGNIISGGNWVSSDSGSKPDFIVITFNANYVINKIRTLLGVPTGTEPVLDVTTKTEVPSDYTVQYSPDGTTWFDINRIIGSSIVYKEHTFSPVSAKAIRVKIDAAPLGWAYAGELEAYTVSGYDAHTLLLLHMDGTNGSTTFTDSSTYLRTVTSFNGAAISTAQSKFGGASGLFDAAGEYLTTGTQADLSFAGDFTIECFVYLNTTASNSYVVGSGHTTYTTGSFVMGLIGALGGFGVVWNGASSNLAVGVSATTWTHFALVRSGTTLSLYKNGVLAQSATGVSATLNLNASNNTYIGRTGWDTAAPNMYVDELRISNVARYTGNFTAPIAPFDGVPQELVTNGTFATATDWNLGSGVSYGTNKLTASSAARIANQSLFILNGNFYRLVYTRNKTGTTGSSRIRASLSSSLTSEGNVFYIETANPANGNSVETAYFQASSNAILSLAADSGVWSGDINSVSVKEVMRADGAEITTNSNFATASGWSLGSGVSYGTNKITASNAAFIAGQNCGLVRGQLYKFIIEGTKTGATTASRLGLTVSTSSSADGSVAIYTQASNPANGAFTITGYFTGVDNCITVAARDAVWSGDITKFQVIAQNITE